MGNAKFFDDIVDKKLYDMHTAYLAKVISVSGTNAKVQPLDMIKQYGESAQTQAVVSNVPITKSAQNKIAKQTISIDGKSYDLAVLSPISAGDIVICVCCDRNISYSRKGVISVPTAGHHSISDSVIVGIL